MCVHSLYNCTVSNGLYLSSAQTADSSSIGGDGRGGEWVCTSESG